MSTIHSLIRTAIAASLLAGCLPPIPHGPEYQQLPPNSSADDVAVFTDEQPKRQYREIGHIDTRATTGELQGYGPLVADARSRAARMGADAIIVKRRVIHETETVERGTGRARHFETIMHETPAISAVAIAWADPR
jgi:hypothetical protein